jgi:hypothetical protein
MAPPTRDEALSKPFELGEKNRSIVYTNQTVIYLINCVQHVLLPQHSRQNRQSHPNDSLTLGVHLSSL